MESRDNDNDGSDIFWPGYVDAVTNLVLNLLFLLTIMTVAVFMFALELGRASQGGPETTPVASTKQDAKAVSKEKIDPVKENIALKREIERLNMMLAQRGSKNAQPVQPGGGMGMVKTVDVTASVPEPLQGLDKTLVSDSAITVLFKDDAIAFTPEEKDRLRETLQPIVAKGKATIYAEHPAFFSEAKRIGLFRVLAVRSLLIEMKIPAENIETKHREGNSNANNAIVKVW